MSKFYDISVWSHQAALELRAAKNTMKMIIGRNFMVYPRGNEPPKT